MTSSRSFVLMPEMAARPKPYAPALRRALTRRSSLARDLSIAFAGAAVCTGIRTLLMPFLGFDHTFITFFPALIVAGAVAGVRAALVALATSGLIVWWIFMPPPFSFEFRDPEDVAALGAFIVAGGVSGVFAAYLRTTLIRLWESEDRQQLLADELNHRVKNALATALALATLTAPKSEEGKDFLASYADRMNAISRANTLLTRNGWAATDIASLLEVELAPLGEHVAIHGPVLKLPAHATTSLSMIVHELATNSLKYGALSARGHVDVSWRTHAADPRAVLTWIETGGPTVTRPAGLGAGFGSQLIARLAEKELGGSAELDFRPDGLRAEIAFPVEGART